jgi:hypothetical protein
MLSCPQAPLMVGDYVTYAGVLTGSGFFSAYEVVSNVAIYTKVRRHAPHPVASFWAPPAFHHHRSCWPAAAAAAPAAFCATEAQPQACPAGALQLQAGVDPAYTVFEVAITPTGGLNVAGAIEAATRSRYEVPGLRVYVLGMWRVTRTPGRR